MSLRHKTMARTSVVAAAAVLVLAACGNGEDSTDGSTQAAGTEDGAAGGSADGALSGDIAIDGSSTVTPLTEPAAEHEKTATGDGVTDDDPGQLAGIGVEVSPDVWQGDIDHGHVDRDEELQE